MPPSSTIDAPAALGFRWPAEWEPQAAIWLAWPHNPETWPGLLPRVVDRYVELAQRITRYQPLRVLAAGPVREQAAARLAGLPQVEILPIPTDDAWIRDYGPLFLKHDQTGETAAVCWRYNAWGGKYPPFDQDDAAGPAIAAGLKLRTFPQRLVLEGGSVETDGAGTLLTTEECLLHPSRNPSLPRPRIEDALRENLGVRHILWLRGELPGDDTDGHIDQIARFARPGVVLLTQSSADHPLAALFAENRRRLQSARDAAGRAFEIVPLPLPALHDPAGQPLPASYANFLILNGAVLVPQFDDPLDEEALATFADLFPDRALEPFPAQELVAGLGAIHCLTMQQCA